MSNRRRPQRRDAHGAPVRTRQELWIAIATGAGVLLVTVVLVIWLQNETSTPTVSTPPSTQANPTGSTPATTATTAVSDPTSTPTAETPSTTASTPDTSASTAPVVSTTKP